MLVALAVVIIAAVLVTVVTVIVALQIASNRKLIAAAVAAAVVTYSLKELSVASSTLPQAVVCISAVTSLWQGCNVLQMSRLANDISSTCNYCTMHDEQWPCMHTSGSRQSNETCLFSNLAIRVLCVPHFVCCCCVALSCEHIALADDACYVYYMSSYYQNNVNAAQCSTW
jgi:hypothetical protein